MKLNLQKIQFVSSVSIDGKFLITQRYYFTKNDKNK